MKPIQLLLPAVVILSLLGSSACEVPAFQEAVPTPAGTVITVGFTTSLSGRYAGPSTDQTNGFLLWIKMVNESGRLRLANGDLVTMAYKSYDDLSDPTTTAEMYTTLISADDVDFLFGPYSDELTAVAAPLAEQYGKLLISAGAAADSTFQKNYHSIYQVYSPASSYLLPATDILYTLDPSSTRIAFLTEDNAQSSSAVAAILPTIQIFAYQVVYQQEYSPETTDFYSQVSALKAAQPNILLLGGESANEILLMQELARQEVKANLVVLLNAPAGLDFGSQGEAVNGIAGPSQWEPAVIYTDTIITDPRAVWYGPSGAEFRLQYESEYGQEPTYHAAGGYTAGLLLQYAIEQSSTVRTEFMLPVLDSANLATFFGALRFDPQGRNHGMQTGHRIVYVQWQTDTNGDLVKRVVWPPDMASSPILYPRP